jgi:hypothetical protein
VGGQEGYKGDYVLFPGQGNPGREAHPSRSSRTTRFKPDRRHPPRREAREGGGRSNGAPATASAADWWATCADQTGDVTLALQAIGDRDLTMATHYRSAGTTRSSATGLGAVG